VIGTLALNVERAADGALAVLFILAPMTDAPQPTARQFFCPSPASTSTHRPVIGR